MGGVAFILPVRGGSGGAHSVMQEVDAIRALGVEARVLVNARNHAALRRNYARFDWGEQGITPFEGVKALGEALAGAEVAVATTNTSVHHLAEAIRNHKVTARPAYYVQDYEPLFYAPGTEPWNIAVASFAVLDRCTYFAKTSWLRRIVTACHGHAVEAVVPSIDHAMYRPMAPPPGGRRLVCAMVRPATPRRAPHRTMRVLGRLAAAHAEATDFLAFGAAEDEMRAAGVSDYDGVAQMGILRQQDVAALLQRADLFLDLSDYQGFGRTAAEAMACGTIAIAPAVGGASDFITHGVNGFLADTTDEDEILRVAEQALSLTTRELRIMQFAAVAAVERFTTFAAAISELRVLGLERG